jgi:hypothetical protein
VAANTFKKGSKYARLANTVWRDFDQEFAGKIGNVVNVRVPARLTAREFSGSDGGTAFAEHTSPIVLDPITETNITVTLDKIPYHAAKITDEDLTLEIADFGAQVLDPQVIAVAEKVERYLAAEMTGASYQTTVSMDPDDPWAGIMLARSALNKERVGRTERFLAIGADVEAAILSDPDLLRKVDASGSTAALREGEMGRLGGFTLVPTNWLPDDEAYAYHKTAFVLATRAPVVPAGAVDGGSASYGGVSVRWLRDYDAMYLQDRSIVDTFSGTENVKDVPVAGGSAALVRAVKIELSGS